MKKVIRECLGLLDLVDAYFEVLKPYLCKFGIIRLWLKKKGVLHITVKYSH